jgi:hypothetical protein
MVTGEGLRKDGTSIEYFKNLVEALNSDYIFKPSFVWQFSNFLKLFSRFFSEDFILKFRKLLKRDTPPQIKVLMDTYYNENIESIIFYDAVCAIKKFSIPKLQPFKSIITKNEDADMENMFTNIHGKNSAKNEEAYIQGIRNMFG